MTLFKLATKNIKINFYNYFIYFISVIFNVVIFFSFMSIKYNNQVLRLIENNKDISGAFSAASFILINFSIVFIWYSSSYFMRQRKKEIALYSLLGIRKRKIAILIFFENYCLGIIALFIGLILGNIFSKLFSMLLLYILNLRIPVKFHIDNTTILITILTFNILFFISSMNCSRIIYKYKLIELLNKKNNKIPSSKGSIFLSILSVLIILLGYVIGLNINVKGFYIHNIMFTLIIVVIGTFLFFNYFLIGLVKFLKKSKIYYKNLNIITITKLNSRSKSNATTLALISLLTAVILTSIASTYSLYYQFNNILDYNYKIDYAYISDGNKELEKKIENIINKYDNDNIISRYNLNFKKVHAILPKINYVGKINLISQTEYNLISNYPIKTKLSDNYCILYNPIIKNTKFQNRKISLQSSILNKDLYIKQSKNTAFMGLLNDFTIIVNDNMYNQYISHNYNITTYRLEKHYNFNKISYLLKKAAPNFKAIDIYNVKTTVHVTALLLFIGIFVGLIFMISTISIVSFKQINEAQNDIRNFQILKKLGVTKRELKKSVANQLLFIFGSSLLVGLIHSIIALTMLSKILNANIIQPCSIILITYSVIYVIYYFITLNSYTKVLNNTETSN